NRNSRQALTNVKGHPSGRSGLGLEQAVELDAGHLPKELHSWNEVPQSVSDVSNQLTLFAEAFPANLTPWLADAVALPTTATSGRTSPDSFATLNPDGSWRKTCQGYSQVMLDGSLEPFSETWPRAGMTRNGIAYRLPPSAPLTDATACGSWPTPCAEDAKNVPYQKGDH